MNINIAKRKEILEKKVLLANVSNTLKSEFIGIDEVIDNIIDSFEPWYIFPECVVKPIIVNMWGMTGTGKTSLIKRLIEILNLESIYTHIDVGEFNDQYRATLKNYISDDIFIESNSMIFCFDEFQFAKTINENYREIDKQGTRMIWEFIDTGKIPNQTYRRSNHSDVSNLCMALKDCQKFNIEIKNGNVLNRKEDFLNVLEGYFINYSKRDLEEEELSLIPSNYFDDVFEIAESKFSTKKHLKDYICKLNLNDTITFLESLLCDNKISKPIDLSKSLIFIIGNLDEAYNLSDDTDPDKDADLFHQLSKKINLSTIKRALLSRFRGEQVARLGNNHIIYPAFSSDNYKQLIEIELNKSGKKFKNNFGIEIDFSSKIYDLIYKESVFPSQGARPIITSMSLLIESFFTKIMNDICLKYDAIDKILWDYHDENYFISCYNQEQFLEEFMYHVNLKVEKDRTSNDLDLNANVAVHEAGHALVHAFQTRILPKKISCVSANDYDCGKTTLDLPRNNITTKKLIKDKIMIVLGGYLAEKMIFGEDNVSTGSESDIYEASKMINKYIKCSGMGSIPAAISYPAENRNEYFAYDEKYQVEGINLLNECINNTNELLINSKKVLIELAKELSVKFTLNRDEIEVIIKKYSNEKWIAEDGFIASSEYHKFHDILFEKSIS
jgi:cell division protease FtsH